VITLGILTVVALIIGGVVHPKMRPWFLEKTNDEEKPAPAALTAHSDKLKEWKQIFRATVISIDGEVSPEMEAFLADPAPAPKPKQLAPHEEKGKHLLTGNVEKEFEGDIEVATSDDEQTDVIWRWHVKGYLFGPKMRSRLLINAHRRRTRDWLRKLFDQQDRDQTPVSAVTDVTDKKTKD
jgi:hypothetical protein